MDYSNTMQFLHLQANVVEDVPDQVIVEKSKAPAVLPHFIPALQHLVEEVQVELVFESGDQPHGWHGEVVLCVVVGISNLVQCMLLHVDIVLPLHGAHALNLADLQGEVAVLEFLWVDLKDLGEVAIAELAYGLKHLNGQGLFFRMLLNEFFWVHFAQELVCWPVFLLALHRAIGDLVALRALLERLVLVRPCACLLANLALVLPLVVLRLTAVNCLNSILL